MQQCLSWEKISRYYLVVVLQMVNSTLQHIPTAELILELQARGIDMSSAIEQMQAQRKQNEQGKVILFPKAKTG